MLSTRLTAWVNERSTSLDVYGHNTQINFMGCRVIPRKASTLVDLKIREKSHWILTWWGHNTQSLLAPCREHSPLGEASLYGWSPVWIQLLLHYIQKTIYSLPWSSPVLLNWRPDVQWSFPERWVFSAPCRIYGIPRKTSCDGQATNYSNFKL